MLDFPCLSYGRIVPVRTTNRDGATFTSSVLAPAQSVVKILALSLHALLAESMETSWAPDDLEFSRC